MNSNSYVICESAIDRTFLTRTYRVEVPAGVADVEEWIRDHQDEISAAADDLVDWESSDSWDAGDITTEEIDVIADDGTDRPTVKIESEEE